jgi:uncharacterized membrane protein YhaH (DUF805 family)
MDVNAIVELFRRTVTEHYFDMSGRVGRKEYWWFVAACIAVSIAATIIDAILGISLLRPLVGLALLLPMAGMGARRLQDTGRNGSLVWALIGIYALMLVLVLLAGVSAIIGAFVFVGMFAGVMMLLSLAALVLAVILIYFWIQPGTPGPNAYGPVPPDFDPAAPVVPKAS